MIDLSVLPIFLTAVFVLMIVPGPDMIFVTANALAGGWKSGLVSVLGVATGAYLHVIAAAAGLSALITSSELAFSVVRYGGALYLAWVGITFLRSTSSIGPIDPAAKKPLAVTFRQGVLTNLLNPKAALFTLSFVPQFVALDHGPAWSQMMVLGIVICVVMILIELPLVFAAGRFSQKLVANSQASNGVGKLAGLCLIGLAAYVALSRREAN